VSDARVIRRAVALTQTANYLT